MKKRGRDHFSPSATRSTSSQLLAGLGWVIFSLSLSHLLLLIVPFLFFSFKAAKEEQLLRDRHPAEYEEYARRVRKFIPFIY